jgi:hypothetical protein
MAFYSIEFRIIYSHNFGKKYKFGVYFQSNLVEELGVLSIDNNKNRYLRLDFDRFYYYLSMGAKVVCNHSSSVFSSVLKELLQLQSARFNLNK